MTAILFEFKKTDDGYILTHYAQRYCFEEGHISEITIPAEHDGLPVSEIAENAFGYAWSLRKVTVSEGIGRIGEGAFTNCKNLRSVSLPASLAEVGKGAFQRCGELCDVEFKSYPSLGKSVFRYDFKLPAELILAGQTGSLDIARAIETKRLKKELRLAREMEDYLPWFTHAGAFALAAKNDSFREVDEELLDGLIEYSAEKKMPELTAYFLELKKRKFGFDGFEGGDQFDV